MCPYMLPTAIGIRVCADALGKIATAEKITDIAMVLCAMVPLVVYESINMFLIGIE